MITPKIRKNKFKLFIQKLNPCGGMTKWNQDLKTFGLTSMMVF